MISKYSQYKNDIFNKLKFPFVRGKTILDVGCGDGTDAEIFSKEYGLSCYGIDIYRHQYIHRSSIKYKLGSIFRIPFKRKFDYIFLHDVLHHIDEQKQRRLKHIEALGNLKSILKPGGWIIVVEGNRYNPIFYPHMVKLEKHDHFKQEYFISLIEDVFIRYNKQFYFFEAHYYPPVLIKLFKLYEFFMETFMPKQFLAYNIACIQNKKEKKGARQMNS